MQPLLADDRATLTEAQVRGLLQTDANITVSYGADALGDDFGTVGDISGYVSAGTVSSDITQTVQRTVQISIDSDVTATGWSYLSGFVKPWTTITNTDTGVSGRFNLGVYTLTTPDDTLGTSPGVLSFSGYDLKYLLNQQVGDSYEVAAGQDPAQAAATAIGVAIPEVSVLVTPSGSTLPTQMSWPFDADEPVTWLQIVDDLLASVGYREPWVDWDGVFRIEPYVDVQTSTVEWTFDAEDVDNIMADGRTRNVDLWDVPNWWRFVMQNLTDTPVEGQTMFTYQDNSATNPGSTVNRGRTFRKIVSVAATSYSDLVNYAQRQISDDLQPSEQFTVSTSPFPLAWHMDVISYLDPQLSGALPSSAGGARRVLAVNWSLDITGMSDMQWTWQTITDQTAALGLAQDTSDDTDPDDTGIG